MTEPWWSRLVAGALNLISGRAYDAGYAAGQRDERARWETKQQAAEKTVEQAVREVGELDPTQVSEELNGWRSEL